MTGPLALSLVPPLPSGWHATPAPAQSGVIATVTGASGHDVHLHPAEYTAPSPRGVSTSHGYAWRCTGCGRLTLGYPSDGFGRAYGDASRHHCEEQRHA